MVTAALDEIRELMGEEKALVLLADLAVDLRRRFASPRADDLAFDAHDMVSAAGLFGFVTLASLCREMEKACRAGADVRLLRSRIEEERRRVLARIEELRRAA